MKYRLTYVVAIVSLIGLTDGCECQRDVGLNNQGVIDKLPLAEKEPDADRPQLVYSKELKIPDASLNRFLDQAATVCEQGDYDQFRQLFAAAYEPTSYSKFERFWKNIEVITVAGIYPGGVKSGDFFVHLNVRLRKPDRRGVGEREDVIRVFKELDDWKMEPASVEVRRAVLWAASRPAEAEKTLAADTP